VTTASAAALEQALAEAGLPCAVEARERLAVVTAPAAVALALADPAARELALRVAAAHGFTHLALELPTAPAGVAATAGPDRAPLPRP
jgi:hypothetical protein